MADKLLKSFLPRLAFAAAHVQWMPLLALLLVVAAMLVNLFLLPARETALDDTERRIATLERATRRALIDNQEKPASPVDTRERLLTRFPTETQLNAELGRILALASEQGLQVPTGDYRLLVGKDGMFDRYILNLPVKGSYQTIRKYVAAVRSEFPDLAVDDISLHRDSIGAAEVEAQLRFVLFGRREA